MKDIVLKRKRSFIFVIMFSTILMSGLTAPQMAAAESINAV